MVEQFCPLCSAKQVDAYHCDRNREYFSCSTCGLVFVEQQYHLSSDDSKKEYDIHINNPSDVGYRNFLNRLFEPMCRLLVSESSGLDFGSGPGPTLSVMFEEYGHKVDLFDPFYAPDKNVFTKQYDFISCSEVVEHLVSPRVELTRLWSCLKSGGCLGVMTKRVIDSVAFSGWHYKNDQTHICFFSDQTVHWLCEFLGAKLVYLEKDVFILKKLSDGVS